MEGPYLILPGRNALTATGPEGRQLPECQPAIIRGHDRLRERVLSGCAATEGASAKAVGVQAAAPATRLVQDHRVLALSGVPGQPAKIR